MIGSNVDLDRLRENLQYLFLASPLARKPWSLLLCLDGWSLTRKYMKSFAATLIVFLNGVQLLLDMI